MPIFAKAGAAFKPAPEGQHAAVCVDVVDLGDLRVEYAGKEKVQHKINVVWQIDEDRDDGKPHQVAKRYTLSLHEKAGLRKDLESWRGRSFTEEELRGFDVEKLIGVPALLNVIHNSSKGSTYANVATLMKLPKSMQAPAQRDYVRVCDRQPEAGQVQESGWEGAPPMDDDVPF